MLAIIITIEGGETFSASITIPKSLAANPKELSPKELSFYLSGQFDVAESDIAEILVVSKDIIIKHYHGGRDF